MVEEKHYIYETADDSYYKLLRQYAKENKMIMTDAESYLWQLLKGKTLGYKFRRQHIVGEFIADFINLRYKLIVEVDGKYHIMPNQIVSDKERTRRLNSLGYTVVRFTNEEVLGNIEWVGKQIKDILKNMEISHPIPANAFISEKNTDSLSRQFEKAHVDGTPSLSGGPGWATVRSTAWAVDAGCSGNPGPMEYRGVDLQTGEQIFCYGPIAGTNNIGEFLAIVHALALMEQRGITDKAIYSDSYNAILWVKNRKCKTKLPLTPETQRAHELIRRAEYWLQTHTVNTPVMKWETRQWGEIPADFGRKK